MRPPTIGHAGPIYGYGAVLHNKINQRGLLGVVSIKRARSEAPHGVGEEYIAFYIICARTTSLYILYARKAHRLYKFSSE